MEKESKALIGTGGVLAVLSSLCCIGPGLAIFGSAGATVFAGKWFVVLRPYFIAVTILAFGIAFYQAYRPKAKPDCDCEEKQTFFGSKGFLWLMAGFSLVMLAVPYYSSFGNVKRPELSSVAASNNRQVVMKISGMGCKDCEGHVNKVLASKNGVKSANTSYENGDALVVFDSTLVSLGQLSIALEKETGYKVEGIK